MIDKGIQLGIAKLRPLSANLPDNISACQTKIAARAQQTSIFRTKARLHLWTILRLELLFNKTKRTVILPRNDKTRDMRRHAIVQMAEIVVHGHYLLHGAPTSVRRRISAYNTRAGATIPYRRADPLQCNMLKHKTLRTPDRTCGVSAFWLLAYAKAATTLSPISAVPMIFSAGVSESAISRVRQPSSRTHSTAASIHAASLVISKA